MNLDEIQVSEEKLNANFKFYLFLKEMNGTAGLNPNQIETLLEPYYLHKTSPLKCIVEIFSVEIDKLKSNDKKVNLHNLLLYIKKEEDLGLFLFALKLLQIKPFLLQEAKLVSRSHLVKKKGLHPLSIEFDRIGKNSAYYTRVNGALIALLFFNHLEQGNKNFLSAVSEEYISDLIACYRETKKYLVEPNEIFMLMFSESINQSIISDAGTYYEDRILNLLLSLGIERSAITKVHDAVDRSTEYDFFFILDKKSYGIGAKRTLRERYKQFIKTSHTAEIDVMIEITLGLDLTIEKAKSIIQHGVYLFVADEIFETREYLKGMGGVYPASQFSLALLKKLATEKI